MAPRAASSYQLPCRQEIARNPVSLDDSKYSADTLRSPPRRSSRLLGEGQVCINYGLGQAPAAACLRLYGFLPGDGRENISVELYVEMAPEAEAFDKKQRRAVARFCASLPPLP